MEFEDKLLYIFLKSPNSEEIQAIAEELEFDHDFSFNKDRNYLQSFWELRRSNSNSPFFNTLFFLIILKFLIPSI